VLYLLVVGAAIAVVYHRVDISAVHAEAAKLNGVLVFALMVILPLFGFPVSVLHVAAGIRFGGLLGQGLVALSILLQLLASYGLVKVWRHHFDRMRWLRRVRARIPKGAHTSICLTGVLLPGAPYWTINYALALVGVPLRTYLACGVPIHTLRSTVTVAFGDQSDELTIGRLALLLGYALTILLTCWWAYRRVRSRLEDQPEAEDGQRQPA
jgi:uncharacterized membrane protein YdjX (TVP38/TMEM64 family)